MTQFQKLMLIIITATASSPAFAYLDPGSGSMLLQVILGGIAGIFVTLKLYWHRIMAFLGLKKKPSEPDGQELD